MNSIYLCIQQDLRYTPPRNNVVHEAETEAAAISWLEHNGGGIYRNVLHNFDCAVSQQGGKQ